MEQDDDSNDCVIVYAKLNPNSTGTTSNITGKGNSTTSFIRSGEQVVRRCPPNFINTQSSRTSQIKEIKEPKRDVCNQHESSLITILNEPRNQDEGISNYKPVDSVIENILQTPVDGGLTEKPSTVKTIVIDLVRLPQKEVNKNAGSHAVAMKPCENAEKPVVLEEKEALNMSASSDEFEGFNDVSENDILLRREVLKNLVSHVSVHPVDTLKFNDCETNNDQQIEKNSKVVNNNEELNVSGSDSTEDFQGFDGISDAEKSLKKFQCINSILVLQKSIELKSLKDSCLNKRLSNTEADASNSEPLKESSTRLKNSGLNEQQSNTETGASKESIDNSISLQESSTTDSQSKTVFPTEHYFVKNGKYQCKYCEEAKSSAPLIRRHLKICADAPLSVIVSSIQYGLNRPVKKKVQPKKKNEKVSTVEANSAISLQNQTLDKSENKTNTDEIKQNQTVNTSENKTNSDSNLNNILKPPKKRGRRKAKDGSVIEEHFVTLLNACDASYSNEPKPPLMSLVKNRLKTTASESLEAESGSKTNSQLPEESAEENNNHLKTDNTIKIVARKVGNDELVVQCKREGKLPDDKDNHLKTYNNIEILESENKLSNTAASNNTANHGGLTLKLSTQKNTLNNDKALSEKKLLKNDVTSFVKKLAENEMVMTVVTPHKKENNVELALEPVTEMDYRKSPGNELLKKRKNDQVKAVTSDKKANCRKVTFQSDAVTNTSNNTNSPILKNVENNHMKTVASENLARSGIGILQPVTQTFCKTDTSNDLASRIGLQPIRSTPNYNVARKAGLRPLLSLEFRNPCTHCSVIIKGFNNYKQHASGHRSQPVRVDSTCNELPKQDSVEKQLPKKKGDDSTLQRINSSNWKKNIMKNYIRSGNPTDSGKTIDCGSDCTVSSSGHCSPPFTETRGVPEELCSGSSRAKSSLPIESFGPNLIRLGSILTKASQDPPFNPDSDSQPRVCDSNETVINSTEYVVTPIDKYISDELQEDNSVCGACLEKFDNLRILINNLYSAHDVCKT